MTDRMFRILHRIKLAGIKAEEIAQYPHRIAANTANAQSIEHLLHVCGKELLEEWQPEEVPLLTHDGHLGAVREE